VEITIVTYTNADISIWKEKQRAAGKSHTFFGKDCHTVTPSEMWAVLGSFIATGISHVKNVDACWSLN